MRVGLGALGAHLRHEEMHNSTELEDMGKDGQRVGKRSSPEREGFMTGKKRSFRYRE